MTTCGACNGKGAIFYKISGFIYNKQEYRKCTICNGTGKLKPIICPHCNKILEDKK